MFISALLTLTIVTPFAHAFTTAFYQAVSTWKATTTTGAPSGRGGVTGAWTGTKMVVWGGELDSSSNPTNTGGQYDPATDSWTATTTTGAPSARTDHGAVWTGTEYIIWGGGNPNSGTMYNTGGRYNPTGNSWTAVTTTNAPTARVYFSTVWTGSKMLVWGGYDNSNELSDGKAYDPVGNSWSAITSTNAPAARDSQTTVWTGTEMVVWGGFGTSSMLNDGKRYNPTSNTWTTMAASGLSARQDSCGVWTGTEVIIWGGMDPDTWTFFNDGKRYNPGSNTWTAMSTTGRPSARAYTSCLWTGSKLVVWSGFDDSTTLSNGAIYDPATDTWSAVVTGNAPTGRGYFAAVWSGTHAIFFGGENEANTSFYNTGGLLYLPDP
jgi:N-acetylneuraminic acid mutarotase